MALFLSRRGKVANAQDLALHESFQCGFRHGGDRDGVSYGIEDFDGITSLAFGNGMVIHDLYDIAPAKIVIAHISCESDVGI